MFPGKLGKIQTKGQTIMIVQYCIIITQKAAIGKGAFSVHRTKAGQH